MCAYWKAILTIGMQLHALSLRTIWSISFPLCPVQYFVEKHYNESETLQSVHTQISTRG